MRKSIYTESFVDLNIKWHKINVKLTYSMSVAAWRQHVTTTMMCTSVPGKMHIFLTVSERYMKKNLPKTITVSQFMRRTDGKKSENEESKINGFIWFTTELYSTTIDDKMCNASSVYLLTIYNFWCILSLSLVFSTSKLTARTFLVHRKKTKWVSNDARDRTREKKDTVPESI